MTAGLRAVIEQKGLFCTLYSDRGDHFWLTPKSGGKVDFDPPTPVGRAMKELGVHRRRGAERFCAEERATTATATI